MSDADQGAHVAYNHKYSRKNTGCVCVNDFIQVQDGGCDTALLIVAMFPDDPTMPTHLIAALRVTQHHQAIYVRWFDTRCPWYGSFKNSLCGKEVSCRVVRWLYS